MKLYGLEKLSLVDYDGKVACTVFTGGCNFKCGFCHNGPLVTETETLAELSEKEVLDYVSSRKNILDGVCVTGGEPTLQKDLPDFLEKLKKTGLSVKLDTNGTNPAMIKSIIENNLADYFATDIKNDKEHYAEIIGFKKYDVSKIDKTLDYFKSYGVDYELRTTLIKEYHHAENIEKIGEWICGAKKYVLQKFKNSDTCITRSLNEVDQSTAEKFLEIAKKYVKNSKLRGY